MRKITKAGKFWLIYVACSIVAIAAMLVMVGCKVTLPSEEDPGTFEAIEGTVVILRGCEELKIESAEADC